MRDLLGGKLWYSVYLDENNADRACVDLEELADALPHGSGLDYDWHVSVTKSGDVCCRTDYHMMDEYGGYCGSTLVRVYLRRAIRDIFRDLIGPMKGKRQVVTRKGDVVMDVKCRNTGKGAGGLRDYLADAMAYELREFETHRNEILNTPTMLTERGAVK